MPSIVAIFAIFCFANAVASSTRRETIFRSLVFPGEEITASEKSKNGELLYAHCRDESAGTRRDVTCTVHLESNTFLPYRACNVSLKADKEATVIDKRKIVHHFGVDKALLAWLERNKTLPADTYYEKITIVNLDDCQTNVAEVEFEDGNIPHGSIDNALGKQVLPYDDDTFDVIYQNAKDCENNYCKVTFNGKGDKTKGPVSWLPMKAGQVSFIGPVVPESSAKGHLVILFDESAKLFNIIIVNDDGMRVLAQYPVHRNIGFSFSNAHDSLGFCHHNLELRSNCTQYDHEGEVKLQTTMRQTREYLAAAMYNLAEGGFLLVNARCALCDERAPQFYLTKVGADGKELDRELEFSGFECNKQNWLRPTSQFFERNGDPRICLNLGCYEWKEPEGGIVTGHLHAVGKCFANEDFVS